jgi:putative ABC transport system permease protein
VLLIGSAFIARDQFKFLIESNLGMTRDQIIAIPGVPDKVKDGYQRFKDRISASPDILKVTACMEVPSREIRDSGPVLVKGGNNNPEEAPVMDIQVIDDDYLDVLGIKLTGGKNIPESLKSAPIPEFTQSYTYVDYLQEQRRVYLINETAMKLLGWQSPEDALGQEISWSISNITLDFGPISGVVKDYHQETLKNTIDPTIMVYEPIWLRTFMIKLKTERIQETIAGIKGVWDELFPQYPMEYYFLDDLYEDLNKNERVKLELLYLLSGQAIIISFIGLFGLIAFSLKTRIKEIAIRKVLGADAGRLIKLIGQEYLLILVLASIVAVPLSYFFIDRWLQQFAYKADISFANYGITVILMGLLILFTVSFQTIKTSSINPADTLREE